MKKILCPTDFSDAAHNAIAYAATLAQKTNCDLTLLNVQSLFDLTPFEVASGKKPDLEGITGQLEAQSREISKTFKISCYAEVEPTYNKLSSAINDKAGQYDLIVMGSHGADDLYKFFTGSNTYHAMVNTKTPVLLIPEGYLYSRIKKIVYAFDYLRERKLPLQRLNTFVRSLHGEVTVLQVMEEAYSKVAEEDLKELQFILKTSLGNDIPLEYDTIRSSEVPQSINSYVLKNRPDVLALCSVNRNFVERLFHKSIIKHISAISGYPVYVFHE